MNTGTETRNTAAANTNQVCRDDINKGKDGDAESVDSNSGILSRPASFTGNSSAIEVVEALYDDNVVLIKVLIIVTNLYFI
jgi:hypothetical protein